MEDTLPVLSPYFRLSTRKLWNVDGDAPHAYLTVGTRVRGEALTGRPGEPL